MTNKKQIQTIPPPEKVLLAAIEYKNKPQKWPVSESLSELAELTSFILPGGTLLASILHLSRTIARRAETHVVGLSQNEEISTFPTVYLNRLSDLLFVLARVSNKRSSVSDIIWSP